MKNTIAAKTYPTVGILDGQTMAQQGETLFINGDAVVASGKTSVTVPVGPGDIIIVTNIKGEEKASYDGYGEYVSNLNVTAPLLKRPDGEVQVVKVGSYAHNVNHDASKCNPKAKVEQAATPVIAREISFS